MASFNRWSFLAIPLVLLACSDPEVILEGERLDPRAIAPGVAGEGQPLTASGPVAAPISLGAMQANADWTHRGGTATHRIGHVALGSGLAPVWTAPIGAGDDRKHRITADPVVAGGRIFALDSRATVTATAPNGATLWSSDLTPPGERANDASGGGLAYGDAHLYVTTGFSEIVALDPASGAVVWRQRLDAPLSGAPTVSGGHVFAVSRDAAAWALDARDGKIAWRIPGTPLAAGALGVSAPAADSQRVVFPFASGQLAAAEPTSGAPLWSGFVAGDRRGRAYTIVSDLTGDPVIEGGVVYAGSAAGRTAATDAETGATIWTIGEGAASPLVPAGGALFLVNDEDQILRLDASTGAVVWRIDLPYFTKDNEKRRRAIVAHYGPVLAGGRLIIASSDGLLRSFDPASGALVGTAEVPGGAASAPVVAGQTLYVVSKAGQLHAFR